VLYQQILRRVLFSMDPEEAHVRTLRALAAAGRAAALAVPGLRVRDARLVTTAFGLTCPGPVGLAAGLDKDAAAVRAWPALGPGFVEIGTVTPQPQPGNPRPRVFRLVEDRALINRLGFNSAGAEAVARHLQRAGKSRVPLGINVGKNRDTPNERAVDDYRRAIEVLAPYADYFAINVSSPNTAGLRDLQRAATIDEIVRAARAAIGPGARTPIAVKLSPDMNDGELNEAIDAVVAAGADGLIVTNTTTSRAGLRAAHAGEAGGLSGAPLREAANAVCRRVYTRTAGRIPIIGVGGIFSAADAYERIRAGATLVQVYTALIYEGPGLFRRLHRGLLRLLERDGLSHINEAVGLDVRRRG
jgi:dihydroorotate dehydrogenase